MVTFGTCLTICLAIGMNHEDCHCLLLASSSKIMHLFPLPPLDFIQEVRGYTVIVGSDGVFSHPVNNCYIRDPV